MKLPIFIILVIIIQVNLYGIERYSKGDTLFNWADKLSLRETPNQSSKIISQIFNGEHVVVNQDKYFKDEDFLIHSESKDWLNAITGKWVEVFYKDQSGFVFDSYLSKYEKDQILNDEFFDKKETMRIPDFEIYYRLRKNDGIVKEIGIGMEWGKTVYYIPDLSIEEAIYLIKEDHIDYKFGERVWRVDIVDQTIEMSESDGVSWKKIAINRLENICVVVIEDGV